ncbi:timeless protein C terminal region-domain-containing protein [Glomus cerebriforme]|uniref:Timeless protein C terminal region-domain-containing protein n=1 Tax=Glomus cerebriforme TaxID=658196 RepID=A0A397T3P8_9GLOM|nr:timeless protein C terminal region-domain-containing protein [Glomus cerebriforme]
MDQATYSDSLRDVIFNICNALGGFETVQKNDGSRKHTYRPGDECLACLKDLKEYLRLKGQVKIDVLNLLYNFETFNTDLIPILLYCTNLHDKRQNRLALACVELMVIMTWPEDPNEQSREILERDDEDNNIDFDINNSTKNEEHNNKKRKEPALSKIRELLTARSNYKFYVLKKSAVIYQIYLLLERYLGIVTKERTERDQNIIRLLLNFCRNLLAIDDPPNSESLSKNKRSQVHHDLILEYKNAKLIDLFLKLSTNKEDALEWDIILIDIFYHIFLGVNPNSLFVDIKKETMWKAQKLLNEELVKKGKRNNVNPHYKGSVWIINPDGPDLVVHKQKALKGDGLQALDDIKKKKYERTKPLDEFDRLRKQQILNPHVQDCLKSTALSFLENGFKFLLRSLKKDLINGEYDDIPQTMVHYSYIVRYFLELRLLLKQKNTIYSYLSSSVSSDDRQKEPHSKNLYDFEIISKIMDGDGIRLAYRMIRLLREKKLWSELHFAVEYLKQNFLTIKVLASSEDVNEKWIADELQIEIYRELVDLEIIPELVREYKSHSQSIGYLQSAVATAHVFLQLLENCVKSNKYVEPCKKLQPLKKKNDKSHTTKETLDSNIMKNYHDEESENEEPNINYKVIFGKIENKFVNEITVKNYTLLLEEYQEIDSESIKHVTMMFFRIAKHCQLEAMFFKLSIMEIFYRILKDYSDTKQRLNHPQKDLKTFIEWIVNKLIIQLKKNPLMYIELLFPKNISDVKLLQNEYVYEIENKKRLKSRKVDNTDTTEKTETPFELQKQSEHVDKILKTRKPRKSQKKLLNVVEFEYNSSLDWPSKIGVVVAILVDEGKLPILQWLQSVVHMVVRKRSKAADGQEPMDYIIMHENEEQKKAIDSDPRIRLLLELLSYVLKSEEKDDKIEQHWVIPSYVSEQDLLASVGWIQYYVDEPYKPTEGTVFDLIKEKKIEPSKRKPRNKRKKKEVEVELQHEEMDKKKSENHVRQRKRTCTKRFMNVNVELNKVQIKSDFIVNDEKEIEKQKKKRIIPDSDDDISEEFAELDGMDIPH